MNDFYISIDLDKTLELLEDDFNVVEKYEKSTSNGFVNIYIIETWYRHVRAIVRVTVVIDSLENKTHISILPKMPIGGMSKTDFGSTRSITDKIYRKLIDYKI